MRNTAEEYSHICTGFNTPYNDKLIMIMTITIRIIYRTWELQSHPPF